VITLYQTYILGKTSLFFFTRIKMRTKISFAGYICPQKLLLKYFRNWKSLEAATMQTRVQVYYGSHAISSYENRTAERRQDLKCKIVKLSKKSIGIFNSNTWHPTLE
jgi:hypothetical protein